MALFLSTYINKVDKKGRVSIPAAFRAELAAEPFQGIVLFRSHAHRCLEGFARSYMQDISGRLDRFDLFSTAQDDLATAVFGDCTQLPFDGEGRVLLPLDLMEFSGIAEQAAFVGMGAKFQLWDPQAYEARREDARRSVREQNLTIPRGDAA